MLYAECYYAECLYIGRHGPQNAVLRSGAFTEVRVSSKSAKFDFKISRANGALNDHIQPICLFEKCHKKSVTFSKM